MKIDLFRDKNSLVSKTGRRTYLEEWERVLVDDAFHLKKCRC
jgi:hypothetical protein